MTVLFANDLGVNANDPAFGQWILYALLAISVLVNARVGIAKLMGKPEKTTVGPQPFVVAKHEEFVKRPEFTDLKKQVEGLSVKMDVEHRELIEAGNKRVADLKDAIHGIKDDLGEKIDCALQQVFHRVNEHESRVSFLEGSLTKPRPK
jgi:hypothetical protein